ncbi:MAG: FimB/Mfa2 family fimbrial subunit [Odoribacter sp.]|nr:FimB/Mfa2 family fimbrial subunit [Odoribacter sp.]
MKRISLYFLLFLLVVSCQDSDNKAGEEEVGNELVEVKFNLTVPAATTVIRSSYTDVSIRNIDLLVFDENNRYIERIKVDDITGTGSIKNFSVRLTESNKKRVFHILANVRGLNNEDLIQFNWITGLTDEGSFNQLSTPHLTNEKAVEALLIMWGRAEVNKIDATTTIGTETNRIQMLRTSAAVRVEYKNDLQNFNLSAFTLIGASDRGIIAQANYTNPAQTPNDVNLPSTYIYNKINYANSGSTGVWGEAYAISDSVKTEELYTYEAKKEQAFVILRASYNGGSDSFYKLAFYDQDDGENRAIIRNHKYIFLIKDVSGPGYPTFNEAVNSEASSNIIYDIYDDDDIIDIVVDGQNKLGLSHNTLFFGGSQSGTFVLTDIVSLNTVTQSPILPVVEYNNVDWISNAVIESSGATGRYQLKATVAYNDINEMRSVVFTIRAGNLRRYVSLTQHPIYD